MNEKSWLYPLTGTLFVAVLMASYVVVGFEYPPVATSDSIQDVVAYYDNAGEQYFGSILQGVSAGILVFFGGYLFKRLRASGAEASAIVTFAGTFAVALAGAIDGTIAIALTALVNGDTEADPGAVQALSTLFGNDYVPLALGMFLFLWGFGAAIVRHGALPRWMGWVAIVAGVTTITPAFFVAAPIALLLILASSIVFAREEKRVEMREEKAVTTVQP
jgi:hypothetical protein